ncbi:LysR family transcriptional regulator [Marinomonas pollencensis]|uniref:DNA-binding transcriptional LysR family regulator n=1 Tax=Marinomonas pollencensis TaxID=491954 RepID=A0A3E0DJ69_9GAMM|nr:LysR family transcriptional regulator [Marinomonas pollencensis]REG82133.1 DNA-binding transcriptional LysR family regulator [Marinomonas pollencensis]
MNIKALRAFLLTLSEGSLSGAALLLNLSQPAVSRLISSLEGELKMQLFYRTGRRLKPTPEALVFYKEAGRILDNLDQIPRIAADIRSGRKESLNIIVMPRIAYALVTPVMKQFMKTDSDTRIHVDIQTRREAYRWLSGREYDFGIGALPIDDSDTKTEVLLRARAQVLMPKDHPLAQKSEVSAEDLINERIIALSPGLLMRNQVDDLFKSAGLMPSYACEVSALMLACQLVTEGVGVTITDSLTTSAINTQNVTLRPIVPERWMSFGLLFPRKFEQSESSQRFMGLLKYRAQLLASKDDTVIATETVIRD